MTKQKSTKRALLLSALSLLMCVSMLIGSTFAWFTDSVTSAGNIIKSGTLDVTMEWKDATDNGEQKSYIDASEGPIFDYDLWEPGYVEAKNIKISNVGTLALKYQLNIVATGEVSKLADVIDVYYAEGEYTLADRKMADLRHIGTLSQVLDAISTTASGDLLASESDTVTLALKMKETAGNEYQNLSIGSEFAVQLMATQLTSEFDSFDNQYDKMATIDTEAELLEALAADYDLITLGANIALTDSVVIPAGKTVAIDLMGYTMSQAKAQTAAYAMIVNKGTLTIKDSVSTGKISYADIGTGGEYASNTIRNEGVLNVAGGTIENISSDEMMSVGYPHAIDVYQGSTTNISGGTIKSANYDSIRMFCNSETLATTVNISGGTVINRVSFQDPSSTKAGYGILNISGGKFITTDDVSANVRLLNFSNVSSNMKATVTGGTFDKGFKTQDIVNAGVKTSDWLTITGGIAVTNVTELQTALNNAVDGDVIKLVADITGDVTVTQKPDVKITIDGNDKTYAGVITVDGESARYDTAALTIQNVNFNADGISADACINLGNGNSATRYTNHVTVKDCTFNGTGDEKVAVKSYTGGDYNLTLDGCVVNSGMHSLAQLKNVETGLKIVNCKVYSKNGINLNETPVFEMSGCTFDVQGYAIRVGTSGSATAEQKTFTVADSTLKSACAESDDAVIVFRGTATNAKLTLTDTTLDGAVEISGNTDATVIEKN